MSDESIKLREATPTELRLLRALVQQMPHIREIAASFNSVLVQPLDDGGMGSFRIAPLSPGRNQRHFGKVAATLQFTDKDGVLVLVSLNTDTQGEPFEVDVWKTDFSPVICVPEVLPG
ncbi:MAG TPA: hypothetical protein VFT45_02270 [Longimicrobium sp.]|nr:hypothetical protein [Longimicrobium sp.]